VTADDAAHFVETFMPGIVSSVAPEITGHGVLDAKVAEEARAAIFREYKRAWEKGNRLDDEGLARLVLRAFSDSNVAGSYGKAHAMRRSRLKRHRAASR
jgi:nicotinamide riboside kinase